jgi:TonB family protein
MIPRPHGGLGAAGMSRTLMVSFFLHIVALSLILVPNLPRPRLTFGPVYDVELVSLPSGGGMSLPAPAAAVGPALLRGLPSAPAAPVRTRVDTSTLPLRKIEVPRKTTDTAAMDKVMEKIRQRATAVSVAPRRPEAAPPASAVASAGRASRTVNEYFAQVGARIHWAFPPALLTREDTRAVLSVRIARTGAVTNVSFEKRSGNKAFDDSALMAVRKASPLPPLPAELGDGNIDVSIVFGPAGVH